MNPKMLLLFAGDNQDQVDDEPEAPNIKIESEMARLDFFNRYALIEFVN